MNHMNYEFCDGITHTIKKGDTLYEISRMHNVPLAMLLRANPYVDVFNLQPGDTICVPAYEAQGEENRRMPETPAALENVPLESRTVREPLSPKERTEAITGEGRDGIKAEAKKEEMQKSNNSQKEWEKYVVVPGDTLGDVMQKTSCDLTEWMEKNGMDNLYLLPGVAYYICK